MRLRKSDVPTRQGVQKPQLSWAKKWTKLRATSNMSRLWSNTMKAPAVGISSKAMQRSNSAAARQIPDGPLTCTAWVLLAPQASSTSRTLTPKGYSYSPGRAQSPETLRILVPADAPVPMPAYQAPPRSAMRQDAAKVSTLFTTVG